VTTPAGTPIHPQFCIIDGLSIRYAESEGRNDDALLLNPWPESLLAFEAIWTRLAGHAHLVAIDNPQVTGPDIGTAAAAGASTGREAT
jgi:hypothetical protein